MYDNFATKLIAVDTMVPNTGEIKMFLKHGIILTHKNWIYR